MDAKAFNQAVAEALPNIKAGNYRWAHAFLREIASDIQRRRTLPEIQQRSLYEVVLQYRNQFDSQLVLFAEASLAQQGEAA